MAFSLTCAQGQIWLSLRMRPLKTLWGQIIWSLTMRAAGDLRLVSGLSVTGAVGGSAVSVLSSRRMLKVVQEGEHRRQSETGWLRRVPPSWAHTESSCARLHPSLSFPLAERALSKDHSSRQPAPSICGVRGPRAAAVYEQRLRSPSEMRYQSGQEEQRPTDTMFSPGFACSTPLAAPLLV